MPRNPDEPTPDEPLAPEVEALLDRLRRAGILYRLTPENAGNGVIHVAVQSERWEIEYFANHPLEVEVFVSNGEVEGEAALERLFDAHTDWALNSAR